MLERLDAFFPYRRVALAMKHGDPFDACRIGTIEDAVREAPHNGFAKIGKYRRMHLRVDRNPVEYLLNPRSKIHAKAGRAAFIIVECVVELLSSFVTQDDRQITAGPSSKPLA